MGSVDGFIHTPKTLPKKRPSDVRTKDWNEIYHVWSDNDSRKQAGRCMDCGIPFCSNGCPLGNLIPEWNDFVYRGEWRKAYESLDSTNNFPEFTGRICPAPCETSCTLAINSDAVTIEAIEKKILEVAWDRGWVKPIPPKERTNKKIAVVGSGPAGLAVAQQLNRVGHNVTVYEKDDKLGGLLQYGIPDFKLEKWVVDRRIDQIKKEGVSFHTCVEVGKDVNTKELLKNFDAICLAVGSTVPRDLPITGRDLNGIHFAMDYLVKQNARGVNGAISSSINGETKIDAKDKDVVIVGGGDTGADCLGTAHREGAKSVVQLEIMEQPSDIRKNSNPWPQWPLIYRTSPAHEEGGMRVYSVLSKRFVGNSSGQVSGIECVRVEWEKDELGKLKIEEVTNSNSTIKADLVLLAMGFMHPKHSGLLDDLGVEYDARGNAKTDTLFSSNVDKVFACGDAQIGQSLVVRAIASGRSCARAIDISLSPDGDTNLPPVTGYFRPKLKAHQS